MMKKRKNVYYGKPLLARSEKRKPPEVWEKMAQKHLKDFLKAGKLRVKEDAGVEFSAFSKRGLYKALLRLARALRRIGQIEGRGERDRMFFELYKTGVISKTGLISNMMKTQKIKRSQAIRYVAEVYGINPSTQSVYLSDEFKVRKQEKEQTRKKRRHRMHSP